MKQKSLPVIAILGAILVILKVTGEITLPWVWVLAPFWIPWAIVLGFFLIPIVFIAVVGFVAFVIDLFWGK